MKKLKLPTESKLGFWLSIGSIVVLTLVIGINIGCFASGNGSAVKAIISVVDLAIVVVDIVLLRKNFNLVYRTGVLDGQIYGLVGTYICQKTDDIP